MKREYYYSNSKKLSYVDFGGKGEILIALHGHFGCATMYSKLSKDLKDNYRIIALDQQGHGFSDWGIKYTKEEYLEDILNLFEKLSIKKASIIGHSLGGVNAYQFASRFPKKVKKLIIEDIGTVIDDSLEFILKWPLTFNSIREFREFLDINQISNYTYFLENLIQKENGWEFRFDSKGLVKSQINLNGNWIEDWNKVKRDILLLRGENSDVLSLENAKRISENKFNVKYIEFKNCGHTIRDVNYYGFKKAVIEFL